jgi:ABC-type multidrug transport system fused ATPase/permease subunit
VVAHDRVTGVLGAPLRVRQVQPVPLPDGPFDVTLEDIRFSHGDDVVLDGVSARLVPGEVVALVGATGTGKSTLCNLLAHLVDPAAGTIRFGGVALTDADPDELHRTVSLVFQETFLFADTVRENLSMGVEIADDEILAALEVARARTFVERLPRGLDEVLGERGVTLSGGQRQRVALARALLRRPRLLLLDDATSAVDARVERAILDGLRGSVAATTLVVAHRVSTIALADRVLLLEGGRIAAEGTHRELLTVPSYAALVRAYEQDAA